MTWPPSRSTRWLEAGLVVLCVLLVLPCGWIGATSPDEAGGPLARWLAGGIGLVSGPGPLAAGLVQGALLVLAGWQLFRLARALDADRLVAVMLGPMLIVCLYRLFPGFSPPWLALPLVLGALQAAFRAHASERSRHWAIAGALAGLSLFTMPRHGVALLACLLAWLAADAWLGRAGVRPSLARLGALGAGALGPSSVILLAVLWQGAPAGLGPEPTPGGPFLTDLSHVTTVTEGWVNLPTWYLKTLSSLYVLALLPGVAVLTAAWGLDRVKARLAAGTAWTPGQAQLALVGGLALAMGGVAVCGPADLPHVAACAAPGLLTAGVYASRWRRRFSGPGLALVAALPHASLAFCLLAGCWLSLQGLRARPDPGQSLTPRVEPLAAADRRRAP